MEIDWNWSNLQIEMALLIRNMSIPKNDNIFTCRVIENMNTPKKLHNITNRLILIEHLQRFMLKILFCFIKYQTFK